MAWRYDDDFGWYDDADPLKPVPSPSVIRGTELAMNPSMVNAALSNLDLRNVGGTYHPDVVMPQPVITSQNIAQGYVPGASQLGNGVTNKFLADLNALATGRDPSVPIGTAPSTVTPAATAPTQAEQWATQFGQRGDAEVIAELNKLSDSELQNLANNQEFLSLYPHLRGSIANILTTRTTTATAAAALIKDQSVWNDNIGVPGTQRAMGSILDMEAGAFSRMTKDLKDYYATEYAARVIRDKGVGTFSASDTLIQLINDGGVVKASQLDAITDPTERTAAATRLANNISKGGNTTDVANSLSAIYMAYFDRVGGSGFGPWASSVGFDTKAYDQITGGNLEQTLALEDNPWGSGLEGLTDPDYVATGANQGAGPMATDATFTMADIAQDLASGALKTAEAIAAYRSLNTAEGNSRATALETGGVDTVKGSFVAPASTSVPTPTPFAAAEPASVTLNRADLLREQGDQEALRRIRAANFGPLAPLGQRVANSMLSQFFGQQPITNMAGLTPREEAFSQFQATPPTAAGLTSALGDIRAAGTSAPGFFNRFLDESGNLRAGAARDAFSASIQPTLTNINPSYRAGYGNFLTNRFADQAALNPGSYQTPDQIMDLMTTAFTGF